MERTYVDTKDLRTISKRPLGALFAFISEEDAHSPIMIPVYEEFSSHYLEEQVPLYFVNIADTDDSELDLFRVYSVPTLIWMKDSQFVTRQVGTVQLKKLEAEADELLDRMIDD